MKTPLKREYRNLVRRYLLWAYKSARESFERIERKTTQLIVDEYIFNYFLENKLEIPQDFKSYIANKRKDELKLKFADGKRGKLHPDYVYLKNRLEALQAAIKHFLGEKQLEQFSRLYEEEFTRRIVEARDH